MSRFLCAQCTTPSLCTVKCKLYWDQTSVGLALLGFYGDTREKAMAAAAEVLKVLALVKTVPEKTWRCFHCDEVFTDRAAALEHFGSDQGETPACKLNALEGGLVAIVREQAAEIRRAANEDTPQHREFFRLGVQCAADVRAAEEAGYAKALEQAAKPLALVIIKEAQRLSESYHPTNVSNARRNLLLAITAVGMDHLIKAPNALAEG